MRAVLQRVTEAWVTADGERAGSIGKGLLVLLGVSASDTPAQAELLAKKTAAMRIFNDDAGKLGRSVVDIGGGVLVVSNFTLYGDCSHGRRPDFTSAASFGEAEALYRRFVSLLPAEGVPSVETGRFGAEMQVGLIGDGPVTILLDTDMLR